VAELDIAAHWKYGCPDRWRTRSKRDGTSINQFVATAVAEKCLLLEPLGSSRIGQRGWSSRPSTRSWSVAAENRPAKRMKCRGSLSAVSRTAAESQSSAAPARLITVKYLAPWCYMRIAPLCHWHRCWKLVLN